jgi:hypothetical protein
MREQPTPDEVERMMAATRQAEAGIVERDAFWLVMSHHNWLRASIQSIDIGRGISPIGPGAEAVPLTPAR